MRSPHVTLLALLALLATTCGGSSGSSGPVTAPAAPSGPAAAPPAVNVGGTLNTQFTQVAWNGQGAADGIASGQWRLVLTQTGADVSGTISALGHAGPFAGTVSGNTLTFNFSVGMGGNGCGNAIAGTATVGASSMTGTFSGHDCAGQAVTNGTFTCALDPGLTTTRFPVAGAWVGALPPAMGKGTSTWVFSQGGDVNGGSLTGTVNVTGGNTLGLTSGTVTGTVANVFPGGSPDVTTTINVTFAGACPANLALTLLYNGTDGQTLTVTKFSGSNCNGPLTPSAWNIVRQ
jgi:hypothetical protein